MEQSLGSDGRVVAGGGLEPLAEVTGLQHHGLSVGPGDGMLDADLPRTREKRDDFIHWGGGERSEVTLGNIIVISRNLKR